METKKGSSNNNQIPVSGQTTTATLSSPCSENRGSHVMGSPANSSNQSQHPNNIINPYIYTDNNYHTTTNNANNSSSHNNNNNNNSPMMDSILKTVNSWSKKAEVTANNIWNNLNTAPSPSSAAWDKLSLNAKAITTGGGFDTIYKHTFSTFPYENLHKTFACYLSTTTGPVSGTLFLSNVHLAFSSDRPIPYTSPSTQITWSHYKVIVPLAKIVALNPVVMRDASSERYLQVVTVEGHDFWFMGFVNFEKAARYITQSLGGLTAHGVPLHPAPSS